MRQHERNNTDYWLDTLEEDHLQRPLSAPLPKSKPNQVRASLAEELYLEENLDGNESPFTYKASRHEQQWISVGLREFYRDNLISDVLSIVKGGKEANVYCCRAHPNIRLPLLAAKIYRPRLLRNLKNDAAYKVGRQYLGDDGKQLHDHRALVAIAKKTKIGAEFAITSWIEHEYVTLSSLYSAGGAVPRPVAQAGNAILMEFIGEEGMAAPALNEIALDPSEAPRLFDTLLENIELLLFHDRIHADLSAYNVLYWEGKVYIIDFPQVVDLYNNPAAFSMLYRDVERICQYFNRNGLNKDPYRIAKSLWDRYVNKQ